MKLALPSKKKALLWTLGVLGTVLVSALGSGVWESLLAPAIHASARWVLDIASLGLTSYKDGVYQEIATDNPSAIGAATLGEVLLVFSTVIMMIILYMLRFLDRIRAQRERLLRTLSEASPASQPDISMEARRQESMARLRVVRRFQLVFYLLLIAVGVVFVQHQFYVARETYVNSADAHYHQVMRVDSPYLDAHEETEIESAFAQIGSRDDYVRLVSQLESQCEAHGQKVPQFNPW